MTAAAPEHASPLRGVSRLLADCARFGGAGRDRPSARARLEGEVGLELARLLVDGLASHRRRPLAER
jgi:hypothetical protein